jgi:hypothetical protein
MNFYLSADFAAVFFYPQITQIFADYADFVRRQEVLSRVKKSKVAPVRWASDDVRPHH